MLRTARGAMERRYARALNGRNQDNGFTLIELIVVVVILGVLAAIAIPAFLSQRQRAYDATTQSDLKNAAVAMESVYASDLAYPETATTSLTDEIKVSSGVTLTFYVTNTPGKESYQVVGENVKSDVKYVLKSDDGAVPTKKTDSWTAPPSAKSFTVPTSGD